MTRFRMPRRRGDDLTPDEVKAAEHQSIEGNKLMSSTPTETEQTDLPPRARVQRELLRLNQTVFAIEQALAEIGELNDHETRAVLVSAEATRGRLVAVMDAVTASNPVGAQSFEHS